MTAHWQHALSLCPQFCRDDCTVASYSFEHVQQQLLGNLLHPLHLVFNTAKGNLLHNAEWGLNLRQQRGSRRGKGD